MPAQIQSLDSCKLQVQQQHGPNLIILVLQRSLPDDMNWNHVQRQQPCHFFQCSLAGRAHDGAAGGGGRCAGAQVARVLQEQRAVADEELQAGAHYEPAV